MAGARRYGELIWRMAVPAVVAGAIVEFAAGQLVHVDRRAAAPGTLDFTAPLLMVAFAVVGLPLGSWIALRLIGVDRAGLVVGAGWAISLGAVLVVQRSVTGGTQAPWVYALCVGCAYALGGLLTRPSRAVRTD